MKSVRDFDFSRKRSLVRVDFNVPQNSNFQVTDSTRISSVKPTIDKIIGDGGSVILMTHLGRPKGERSEAFSLKNIVPEVSKILERDVKFCNDCIGIEAEKMVSELLPREILLLENLRFHKEEEEGNEDFARNLSRLGDVYVNDAFGTAHRRHSSTAVIAKFFPSKKFFGLLMFKELEALDKVLNGGKRPITAILGGAKISSKIAIIENITNVVDNIIIGGAMAFTFIKAKGGSVGKSLVEEDKMDLALSILKNAESKNVKIYLPVDVVAAHDFSNDSETKKCNIYDIPDEMMGLDVGTESSDLFNEVVLDSKTILWNGPLGAFEMEKFSKGTLALAESVTKATSLGSFSLVGGGDSVAFVKQYHYDDKVSYVSTGGGAMLESLEGKELPGVAAINH